MPSSVEYLLGRKWNKLFNVDVGLHPYVYHLLIPSVLKSKTCSVPFIERTLSIQNHHDRRHCRGCPEMLSTCTWNLGRLKSLKTPKNAFAFGDVSRSLVRHQLFSHQVCSCYFTD